MKIEQIDIDELKEIDPEGRVKQLTKLFLETIYSLDDEKLEMSVLISTLGSYLINKKDDDDRIGKSNAFISFLQTIQSMPPFDGDSFGDEDHPVV
jgi:hypothetical protein